MARQRLTEAQLEILRRKVWPHGGQHERRKRRVRVVGLPSQKSAEVAPRHPAYPLAGPRDETETKK